MMLGYPGSGKSFFARQLAEFYGWSRLNRVAVRKELFGQQAALKLPANEDLLNQALADRLAALVASGQSVICDYQHNLRSQRATTSRLVASAGAGAVSVWVQTPSEVAFQRGTSRAEMVDSVRIPKERMRQTIDRVQALFDAPDPDERVVKINGLWPFDKQLSVFSGFISLEKDL